VRRGARAKQGIRSGAEVIETLAIGGREHQLVAGGEHGGDPLAPPRGGLSRPAVDAISGKLYNFVNMNEVSRILDQMQQGDPHAAEALLPLVPNSRRAWMRRPVSRPAAAIFRAVVRRSWMVVGPIFTVRVGPSVRNTAFAGTCSERPRAFAA
jgi:hypothetical protein